MNLWLFKLYYDNGWWWEWWQCGLSFRLLFSTLSVGPDKFLILEEARARLGHGTHQPGVTSMTECEVTCLQHAGCTGFNFYHDSKRCDLLTKRDMCRGTELSPMNDHGVVYGIRPGACGKLYITSFISLSLFWTKSAKIKH